MLNVSQNYLTVTKCSLVPWESRTVREHQPSQIFRISQSRCCYTEPQWGNDWNNFDWHVRGGISVSGICNRNKGRNKYLWNLCKSVLNVRNWVLTFLLEIHIDNRVGALSKIASNVWKCLDLLKMCFRFRVWHQYWIEDWRISAKRLH